MKKKIIIAIAIILVVVVDLFVLLYPTVSDYINSSSQSRVVAQYFDDVSDMDNSNMQLLLQSAHEYNKRLLTKQDRFLFTDAETAEYQGLLNSSRGVMGILVIDRIAVKLPIYHGTDAGVLQVGLGHLQGSSLPVGGTGTHSIITGHRGLPSSTLLTDLNQMAKDDVFVLYVMGETLTYQVDQILIVDPYEVEALGINPDTDYCTLVTCTPYGVNSHRLLVRGRRIDNAENAGWNSVYADAKILDTVRIILIFIIPVLLALLVFIIIKIRKIRKGGIV